MQCVDLGGRRIIKKKSFFQAEAGVRHVERSRGLGDVYKRQRGGCSAVQVPSFKSVDEVFCALRPVLIDKYSCALRPAP